MNKVSYFNLNDETKLEILEHLLVNQNISPNIAEKDIWLSWTLKVLFGMPNRHNMAFKGGTSLSKVYDLINRFSEDIDVSIDMRNFEESKDYSLDMSRSKAKKVREKLEKSVKNYRDTVIVPAFEQAIEKDQLNCKIRVDETGEKIWIDYPTIATSEMNSQYVSPSVLLELGGSNFYDPNETHIIKPDFADSFEAIEFPEATVTVLSPKKTFWEKVVLIHVDCHRTTERYNSNRLSRHWYDLVKLYESPIGQEAIKELSLLEKVVSHNKVFYQASYANFDACLDYNFKLVPDEAKAQALAQDYENMKSSGMLYEDISFEYILAKVKEIETLLNTK